MQQFDWSKAEVHAITEVFKEIVDMGEK